MSKSKRDKLPDIQTTKIKDAAIPQVGEENIDFQFKIYRKRRKDFIITSAKVNLFHWLAGTKKGINMSRIMEVLMEHREIPLDKITIQSLLYKMIEAMERSKKGESKTKIKDVYIKIKFPFFIDKAAPASKKIGLVGYNCAFIGKLMRTKGDKLVFTYALEVEVPCTSLCPCSKGISKYGAHNQRSKITVTVQVGPDETIWLEDLIQLIEKQGACEIYSLLKREDEKAVTEIAYENPCFVEDMIRNTRKALEKLKAVKRFKIGVRNEESIHTHDAVAYIRRYRKGKRWFSPYKIGVI